MRLQTASISSWVAFNRMETIMIEPPLAEPATVRPPTQIKNPLFRVGWLDRKFLLLSGPPTPLYPEWVKRQNRNQNLAPWRPIAAACKWKYNPSRARMQERPQAAIE
jgi:hypothetical protein